MLDYPSASWKRMFLTQPVLREVKARSVSSDWDEPDMIRYYCYSDTAFRKVKDVDGVRMGQIPNTVNHSAKTRSHKTLRESPWIGRQWRWIEIVVGAVVEESGR